MAREMSRLRPSKLREADDESDNRVGCWSRAQIEKMDGALRRGTSPGVSGRAESLMNGKVEPAVTNVVDGDDEADRLAELERLRRIREALKDRLDRHDEAVRRREGAS